MICSERLNIYTTSNDEMQQIILEEKDPFVKKAYKEMLNSAVLHKEQRQWYALWVITLKDGTNIGGCCFKGVGNNGIVEIGYGIKKEYSGNGYATEAVKTITEWAVKQPCVSTVIAEAERDNIASQKVLLKAGYINTGIDNYKILKFKFVWCGKELSSNH